MTNNRKPRGWTATDEMLYARWMESKWQLQLRTVEPLTRQAPPLHTLICRPANARRRLH
jgi:hypothetical protein